jgi:ABC-type multidrug transport system ATPase subunit
VILVDGVDRGLDDANRDRAWAALRSAAERGNTLIATCDSAEAARPHAHQVLGLNHPGPTPADSTTRKGDLR